MNDLDSVKRHVKQVLFEGYTQIRNLVPIELAVRSRSECEDWFRHDLEYRRRNKIESEWLETSQNGLTRYDKKRNRHVLLRADQCSEAVVYMLNSMLEDFLLSNIIKALLGSNFVIGECMVRKATSNAEEWTFYEFHRDNQYELTVGVFLDQIRPNSGGPAIIPRSHLLNWKTGRPMPLCSDNEVDSCHSAKNDNQYLASLEPGEILGDVGDSYIFLGETCHGILKSNSEDSAMLLLCAFFPGKCYFPDDPLNRLRPLPRELMKRCPSNIREAYERRDGGRGPETYLYRKIYEIRESAHTQASEFGQTMEKLLGDL